MNKIIVNDDATLAYSKPLNAVIATPMGATYSQLTDVNANVVGQIYQWGSDNLLPQRIIKDSRRNTIIPSTLAWKAEVLYSGGIQMGYLQYQGKDEVFIPAAPAEHPEAAAFLFSRFTRRYLRQASKAYYWWKMLFPELVLSKDRKKILSLSSLRPEYCRFEKDDNGPKNVYVDGNWQDGHSDVGKNTSVVPLLNPYDDPVGQLRAGRDHKYIYPINDASPGTAYYQEAEWHSVINSGWLNVAQEIPKFKKALFENQITIKYLIEVATWWWNWKYPGFDAFTTDKKKELIGMEHKRFEDFMAGSENSGKSLMLTINSNPEFSREFPGWKISPIDNKLKDGVYIEDSQEASSHIMYALSVDPVLRGFTPGGQTQNSGSEKRVAWNNHIMLTKPHQDDILEVIEFVRDYNGWDPNLKFWFRNYYQATMDVAREPQQQSS
jgi:hypothetical protein